MPMEGTNWFGSSYMDMEIMYIASSLAFEYHSINTIGNTVYFSVHYLIVSRHTRVSCLVSLQTTQPDDRAEIY